MPHIEHRGHRLHYRETGEGPAVVLFHSGGLSSRQWARLTALLAPHYRVLAPDLLGVGESSGVDPSAPFDYMEDVLTVEGLLETLPAPYHVVGHSYGGLVGLTHARRAPDRVASIALFEPVAFGVLYSRGDEAGVRDLEDYDHDGSFFDDGAGGGEAWLERFIDWWQGKGTWRTLPDASRDAFRAVGRKVFQEVRSLTADRTPHDAYTALNTPALFMTAARSPLAARRVAAILAESMPRGVLEVFEDAGHMAPLTHGSAVNTRIHAHLRAAGDGARGSEPVTHAE